MVWKKKISDERRVKIGEALRNGCKCEKCDIFSLQPLITPCGCLLCAWCTKSSKTKCSLCNSEYKMQAIDDKTRKDVNPNPQWSVPIELIELQPAYSSVYTGGFGAQGTGGWRLDYTSLNHESSKIKYLFKKLREFFDQFEWKADPSNFNTGGSWLHINLNNKTKRKVIVFSQFMQHFLAIEQALNRQNVRFARVYLNSNLEKVREIQRFESDPNIPILLMDVSGAVGLDLHFVSHVFLMDPIPDISLEEQIIARAWRMGAQETIHIYRLAMKDSVEHTLLKMRDGEIIDETNAIDEDRNNSNNIDIAEGDESSSIISKNDNEHILLNLKRVKFLNSSNDMPSFISSDKFVGAKKHYIFKHGVQGLGYYLDVVNEKINKGILKKAGETINLISLNTQPSTMQTQRNEGRRMMMMPDEDDENSNSNSSNSGNSTTSSNYQIGNNRFRRTVTYSNGNSISSNNNSNSSSSSRSSSSSSSSSRPLQNQPSSQESLVILANQKIYKKLNAKRFVGIRYKCDDIQNSNGKYAYGKLLLNGYIDSDTSTSGWSREGSNLTPFQWEKTSVKSPHQNQFIKWVVIVDVDGEILETGEIAIKDYILRYDLMTNQNRKKKPTKRVQFSLP